MPSTPQFRTDLYRGTAEDYDRYRVPYPDEMIDDLVSRTGRGGRLVDLACGPGRATFAFAPYFSDVVAIDQERESVEFGGRLGVQHIRWLTGRAEDLTDLSGVDLVTVGDAFHRLDRRRIAGLVRTWLKPGGHLAVLWTSMPWGGSAPWQQEALEWAEHWMQATGSIDLIPADLADSMAEAPNATVLTEAGLMVVGNLEYQVPHVWTLDSLIGFAHSTSIFSKSALGPHVEEFERDLAARLRDVEPSGRFAETVSFACDLAIKPL